MKTREYYQQLQSEINKAIGRLNETAQEYYDKFRRNENTIRIPAKAYKLDWFWHPTVDCILREFDGISTSNATPVLKPEEMLNKIWEIENRLSEYNRNHK